MNNLQMCQRLHSELGAGEGAVPGSLPTTVTGQTGQLLRYVNGVARAWEEIQEDQQDWLFMRKSGTIVTVADTQTYSIIATITDFEKIRPYTAENCDPYIMSYLTATGVTDSQPIYFIPSQEYEGWYDRASFTGTGRPKYYTITDTGLLSLFPIPSDVYTITIPYRRTIQSLTADSDTPIAPTKYHMAIVYKAMEYYGASDENNRQFQTAMASYTKIMRKMYNEQLPEYTLRGRI